VDSDATDQPMIIYCKVKVKDKAITSEAWTGPEGFRDYVNEKFQ